MPDSDYSESFKRAEEEARQTVAMHVNLATVGKDGGDGGQVNVATPSKAYKKLEELRKLPRALVGGTPAMRKAGSTYTPKYKDETESDLTERLKFYHLNDFYDAACKDLASRILAEGLVLEDAPPAIEKLWTAETPGGIDGDGRSGEEFFYDVILEALRFGLSDVEATYPPRETDGEGLPVERTAAQEEALGLAPYLVHHRSESAIEDAPTKGGGATISQRVRIKGATTELVGGGYAETVTRWVRELVRGAEGQTSTVTEHMLDEKSGKWVAGPTVALSVPESAPASVRQAMREVLTTTFFAGFEGHHYAPPPFLNAADLCLENWRKRGNISFIEELANTPSLVYKGEGELDKVSVGSRSVTQIGPNEELEWLVIEPKGVEASKASLERNEEAIRFATRQPAIQRATSKDLVGIRQMDEIRPMTQAQIWAIGFAQAMTECLRQMALFLGLEGGGRVSVPKDALKRLVDPQAFDYILKMIAVDAISVEAAQREAIRYGIIDKEHDIEADLRRLGFEVDEDGGLRPGKEPDPEDDDDDGEEDDED